MTAITTIVPKLRDMLEVPELKISSAPPGIKPVAQILSTPIPSSPTDLEQRIKKTLSNSCILFSLDDKDHFYFLCNDFPSPFEFGGLHYTCAAAAYEAQKFAHQHDFMEQFTTLNGEQAFALSAEKYMEKHPRWYADRRDTMLHILRAKFGQNLALQGLLLLTMDAHLSFHTPIKAMDPFWTDNSDGSGANQLGLLLMAIRREYGGMFGEVPRPENYIDFIPSKKREATPIGPLDKSDHEVLAEIKELNERMDEEHYESHSKKARLHENLNFTRFPSNNFPYDQTLVSLSSDHYINASFILGKQFIGTQSPLPETREDFWSMVLEHNVPIVIMLNRLGDTGGDVYFPLRLSDQSTYGTIHIRLAEEPLLTTHPSWRHAPHEEEPHAVIHRKLCIWREGGPSNHVDHFQYQNWRDFSAGNERAVSYLVKTVDAIRNENRQRPVVVHCHAGVGRTSALITLLDQYPHLSTGDIDIKGSVERQRSATEGRCHSMMQSTDQYAFCYRVLRQMKSLSDR
jgi:protein tyrosine phosphatase/predicted NAD-dependent protein-ADP-ribosyltransferase YbiA (DUF1768 family)